MTDKAIANLVNRLESVTKRLESIEKQIASGASSAPSSGGGDSSASIQEYEDLIAQHIKPYVELSSKIGGPVKTQAEFVIKAVEAQLEFLKVVSQSKKPSDSVFQSLLQPTGENMAKISEIREKEPRSSNFFNHLSTVSEGINALNWVTITPTPGPFIGEMRPAAEFYSNRILKEFKGKDETQVSWVNAFIGFLKELQPYVKRNHTTGVSWNPNGGDASSHSSTGSAPGAPPPPSGPPPPPGPPPPVTTSSSSGAPPDMGAVFSQINKGDAVTAGLKKVTADMKTKNNPNKTSIVKADDLPKKAAPRATQKTEVVKPPKLGLEGNKWVIEHQVDNRNIVISDTEAKQTAYIFKCKNTTIQIKGKINAITLDNCTRTSIVFDNLVASFEIVNCTSVEVQVLGKVPTVLVDKTSGLQLILSQESLDAEIVSSKSSEMNVLFNPDGNPSSV